MEKPSLRVRLAFEDRRMLSKSQKSLGLKRCWFLLLPSQHQSISDLSDHIIHKFDLHHSCPHGLFLTMDGFVLPSFESTSILKEKDIICVKKKVSASSNTIKVGGTANLIEEVDAVKKQPLHTGMLLLANEEFEKETGGYQSETDEEQEKDYEVEETEQESRDDTLHDKNSEDDAVSKKRKAPKELQISKKKKQRLDDTNGDKNSVSKQQKSCNGGIHHGKNYRKKKVFIANGKPEICSTSEIAERQNKNSGITPNIKRSDQFQDDDDKGDEDAVLMPEATKKLPSRSARRKKAKRKWLREMAKIQQKEIVEPSKKFVNESQKLHNTAKIDVNDHPKGLLHWKQFPEKDIHKQDNCEQTNQSSDGEDNFVPVVVRPGHIRFEPARKDGDQVIIQQSHTSTQAFQWNGITNKKKGQKWGKDNSTSSWRNNHREVSKEYNEMPTTSGDILSKQNSRKEVSKEYNEMPASSGDILAKHTIDFDKLPVLSSLPKEGDMIAYRLLELSSSWTPELSSFRVGNVLWCNHESAKLKLISVPEYPVINEKRDNDESTPEPVDSLHGEDGSLEIDFSSLVDVRLVKHGDADPVKPATGAADDVPITNKDVPATTSNDKQTPAPRRENGDLWELFSETLTAKKGELSQEKGWNTESSGRSWSYRALRGSALGPAMAILRSKNQI